MRVVVVEVTEEFRIWYEDLSEAEQDSIYRVVTLLEVRGVALGAPYSSAIQGSRYALRELRIQHQGEPYRVFYAFDPKRQAVLLMGGNKVGNDRFYEEYVPTAEAIWEAYIAEQAAEGENPE